MVFLVLQKHRAPPSHGRWRKAAAEVFSAEPSCAPALARVSRSQISPTNSVRSTTNLLVEQYRTEVRLVAQYHLVPVGPENSRTYDGGVDQSLFAGRSRISLSLFHNEFTNGIEYVGSQELNVLGISPVVSNILGVYGGASVNSKAYRAQGAEAELELQVVRNSSSAQDIPTPMRRFRIHLVAMLSGPLQSRFKLFKYCDWCV